MDTRYSEAELTKFLNYLANKGILKSATARARKAAVQKILSVIDSTEKNDLRTIDRESVLHRFINKFGQEFTPDSLQTYRQRFNVALDDFTAYVNNPATFRPLSPQRTRVTRANDQQPDISPGPANRKSTQNTPAVAPKTEGLVGFPVPLPSGAMAHLYLPEKITAGDAERIAAVVRALAVGQEGTIKK